MAGTPPPLVANPFCNCPPPPGGLGGLPGNVRVPNIGDSPFDSPPKKPSPEGKREGEGDGKALRLVIDSVDKLPLPYDATLLKEFPCVLLENVGGNGCFAGATLQSVLRVPPLAKYILKQAEYLVTYKAELIKRYEDHYRTLTRRLESASQRPAGTLVREPHRDPKTSLLLETLLLLSHMYLPTPRELELADKKGKGQRGQKAKKGRKKEEGAVVSLRAESMYTTMVRSSNDFVVGRQEDATEAREFLLEGLHSELVAATELARTRNTDAPRDMTLDQASRDANTGTAVSDIFRGVLKSTVTCGDCGTKSDRDREVTWSLNVPMLDCVVDLTDGGNGGRASIDGLACVQSFFAPEEMKGDNQYFCACCGKKCNATVQISMPTVPPDVSVNFERFAGLSKNQTHVQLPEELDFSPFADQQEGAPPMEKHKLMSVVEHEGRTRHGGHYRTYKCKTLPNGQSKWFVYDDQVGYIREVSLEFVLGRQAYMAEYVQPNALAAVSPPDLADAPPPPINDPPAIVVNDEDAPPAAPAAPANPPIVKADDNKKAGGKKRKGRCEDKDEKGKEKEDTAPKKGKWEGRLRAGNELLVKEEKVETQERAEKEKAGGKKRRSPRLLAEPDLAKVKKEISKNKPAKQGGDKGKSKGKGGKPAPKPKAMLQGKKPLPTGPTQAGDHAAAIPQPPAEKAKPKSKKKPRKAAKPQPPAQKAADRKKAAGPTGGRKGGKEAKEAKGKKAKKAIVKDKAA
ncbi:unnamed protein product [Vitrella brassicaformis CCMP3155]|uniref:USP domain-containing protein n=1 Tax=Vitrella brassicaformis (strain CCMP3155) TaxID=1169540 RepID=A0A0G4ESB1_VITBC|nr:unnamed protein product [Vitrella brassicaformis CCMP3155]|eukprot:CEM00802.1 unnamed protein product [Vitrella brassicaformis CCMP3155]